MTCLLAGVLAAMALTGCKPVGPDYQRPQMTAPTAYKEVPPPPDLPGGSWKVATDNDAAPRGAWWKAFGDPQLDVLEERVDSANLQLRSAESQYRAATEMIRVARAAYMPQASVGFTPQRENTSHNSGNVPKVSRYDDFALNVQASWDPDLWGRIRRGVESSMASAQSSAADMASVKLSLEAQLALAYMDLRGLESQAHLLNQTITLLTSQVELTQQRFDGGVASEVDVVQAQSQLDATRAQVVELEQSRSEYVNAIAILAGQQPSDFSLTAVPLEEKTLPTVPAGIPSELLERRPDIAAAERRVAKANADVGVTIAAFYPSITLGTGSPGAGFDSKSLTSLIQGPSAVWSLGARATQFLLDGGLRKATSAAARDNLDSASALYRQTVLSSFAEVENDLASLRVLAHESQLQERASREAARSLELSRERYEKGMTSYLEVITAENTLLSDQRTEATLITRRYAATVDLLRALGGGWNRSQLP
jgi:NodT family efflux transporter outer membrane factor (OMF) lipoprotein